MWLLVVGAISAALACYWALSFWLLVRENRVIAAQIKQHLASVTDHQREQAKAWFVNLKQVGSQVPAVSPAVNPTFPPQWYDADRFHRAQEVCQTYYLSLSMGSLAGLLTGIQIPEGVLPLLVGGNHFSIASLYKRYISTTGRVSDWYSPESGDPFDPKSKLYKSISMVRLMHTAIHQKMNDQDPARVTRDGRLWVSQSDMAYTQFAFIGFAMLFPTEAGLHSTTLEEFESIFYVWRVLGHVLGMENGYNLCGDGAYGDVHLRCKQFLDEDYVKYASTGATVPKVPGTKEEEAKNSAQGHLGSELGWEMGKGIIMSLHGFNPFNEWTSFMRYWYQVLGWETEPRLALVTWSSKWRYAYYNFSVNVIHQSRDLSAWLSKMVRRSLARERRNMAAREKVLAAQYPEERITYRDLRRGNDFSEIRRQIYEPLIHPHMAPVMDKDKMAARYMYSAKLNGSACPFSSGGGGIAHRTIAVPNSLVSVA